MHEQNQVIFEGLQIFILSSQHRNLVRCAMPDCSWGFEFTGLAQIHKCYDAFRQHCLEMHRLDPDDSETIMSLDTGEWLMHLLKL